jgi:hypothetical protein
LIGKHSNRELIVGADPDKDRVDCNDFRDENLLHVWKRNGIREEKIDHPSESRDLDDTRTLVGKDVNVLKERLNSELPLPNLRFRRVEVSDGQ